MIKLGERARKYGDIDECTELTIYEDMHEVKNAPAVDVDSEYKHSFEMIAAKYAKIQDKMLKGELVEVCLCKDCKHSMLWRKPTDKVIGECAIRKWNSDTEEFCQVGADDFCSYGERRAGE